MITERKYCKTCKTTDESVLSKSSTYTNKFGDTFVYFLCRTCRSEARKKWYENGGREKIVANNRHYRRRQIKI